MSIKTVKMSDGKTYDLPLTGNYVVGCNGLEEPIRWNSKHYVYMWDKPTNTHDYYCLEDDLSLPQAPWEQ